MDYVDPFETYLDGLRSADFDVAIASGGGRMKITMDRYEADWSMVQRGWDIHVKGEGRQFASAHEAIETYRNELGVIDQDLPGFVVSKDGQPLGKIGDGDAVVFFNFRGDRAIEISRAFTEETFCPFHRGPLPKVTYAGMMQYDGDTKLPPRFLVEPPAISRTMGEYLPKTAWRNTRSAKPKNTATSLISGTATAPANSTTRWKPTSKSPATWCRSSNGHG